MSFEHVKRILSAEESSLLVSLSTVFSSSLFSSVVTLIAKSTTRREKEDEQRKAFCGLMRSAYINMRRFCVNSREKFLLISILSTLPPHHHHHHCLPTQRTKQGRLNLWCQTNLHQENWRQKKEETLFFCCVMCEALLLRRYLFIFMSLENVISTLHSLCLFGFFIYSRRDKKWKIFFLKYVTMENFSLGEMNVREE